MLKFKTWYYFIINKTLLSQFVRDNTNDPVMTITETKCCGFQNLKVQTILRYNKPMFIDEC